MLQTVLTAEHFLFDIHELRCFDDYTKLSGMLSSMRAFGVV